MSNLTKEKIEECLDTLNEILFEVSKEIENESEIVFDYFGDDFELDIESVVRFLFSARLDEYSEEEIKYKVFRNYEQVAEMNTHKSKLLETFYPR